jgi:hypothetical protein
MTDISKYKSVALSHDSCSKLDKIRINEKARKLNGKLSKTSNA